MKNHVFLAFQERSYVFFWLGEIFTQIAINLFNFFLILIVFQLTHSNTSVSGIVIAITVPTILFGIIAGVYIDRWDKKKVLLTTNILRAALLILLALVNINIVWVFIIAFLISVVTQFFIPAETSLIPHIVKQKSLLSANALFGMGIHGSILIAFMLSGPMIKYLGNINSLIALAILMLTGALFISFIQYTNETKGTKLDIPKPKEASYAIMRELKYVFSIATSSREISMSLFLLALAQIIILIVAAVAPGYADQVLNINVEDFPLLFITPAALGVVVGAILLVNIFHVHAKARVVSVGVLLSGIALAVLPYGSKIASRDIVLAINSYLPSFLAIANTDIVATLAFVLGFANALVFVPSNTTLQEKTPNVFRGRVYGVLNSLVGVLSFIPLIAVGGLADIIGVGRVIMGIGLSLIILGVLRLVVRE